MSLPWPDTLARWSKYLPSFTFRTPLETFYHLFEHPTRTRYQVEKILSNVISFRTPKYWVVFVVIY